LWYRSLSSTEMLNIDADPNVIYDYSFFRDKLFTRFNLENFQMIAYNSGSVIEMNLSISPSYNAWYHGEDWVTLPRDELFQYSLVF
jgi:hypothetical protein